MWWIEMQPVSINVLQNRNMKIDRLSLLPPVQGWLYRQLLSGRQVEKINLDHLVSC